MAVSGKMEPPPTGSSNDEAAVFLSRDVVGGVPWVVFTRLLLFFVYLGIPIFTAKYLGPTQYGQFSLCRTIGELMLILAGLGLNTALVRFIPELQVQQNKAGLLRLLRKIGMLQAAGWLFFAAGLYLMTPFLSKLLALEPSYLILLAALIPAAQLAKNFVMDVFTSMFRVRVASFLSISQSTLWFILLLGFLKFIPRVDVAILILVMPTACLAILGIVLLARHMRRLDWRSPEMGIGKKRVSNIAIPSLINSAGGLLLRQYSELFFIGAYFPRTAAVAIYDLGCQLPALIINFIPQAIQGLFSSGFAEAYAKDKTCLPRVIDAFYKALIVTVLPLTALGVALSPRAIELIYGPEMAPTGVLASAFFLYHSASMISLPLSIALLTREKVLHAQPLMILQVAANLLLDFLLIPRYGIWGGFAAVALTWFVTIPVRLYVVGRLLDGIYFPTRFFLRFLVLLLAMAAVGWPLSRHAGFLGLALLAVALTAVYLGAIRVFRMISPEDVVDLRNLQFRSLNRCLDLLVGR